MSTGVHDLLSGAVNASWRRFLDTYEPLRPDLYRYCRHLTRSAWDAEDMVLAAPRCELRAHRGESIFLWWSGDEVHAVVRVDVNGDRIARLRSYSRVAARGTGHRLRRGACHPRRSRSLSAAAAPERRDTPAEAIEQRWARFMRWPDTSQPTGSPP